MPDLAALLDVSGLARLYARLCGLAIVALMTVAVSTATSWAADCSGNATALGTARILRVDAATTPRVGRKQFPQTLPLARKEVVLTFDDGPEPGSTRRILDALRHECVKATFFLLGQSAQAHPDLARRELADGHTIGNHTFSHPLLNRISVASAQSQIDRGFAAIDTVLYGSATPAPRTPFFRFPGFASSPALLELLQRRGIVVFGADLWASDWNRMTPQQELALVLSRIEANQGGIVLLHDTKAQTAAMLPALLRSLHQRGYGVDHVVAAASAAAPASTP